MAENAFGRLDDPAAVERIRTQLGLPSQNGQAVDDRRPQTQSTVEVKSGDSKIERAEQGGGAYTIDPVADDLSFLPLLPYTPAEDELAYMPLLPEETHPTGARVS